MRYRRCNSLRMPGYVYTTPGMYFVTINARHSRALFGKIQGGVMYPNEIGQCIIAHWYDIPSHHAHVTMDEFQLMPNHLHGIIVLQDYGQRGNADDDIHREMPTRYHRSGCQLRAGSLSVIVGAFKAGVTRSINQKRASGRKLQIWHRNYHESIIRSNIGLARVRQYIRNNVRNYKAPVADGGKAGNEEEGAMNGARGGGAGDEEEGA